MNRKSIIKTLSVIAVLAVAITGIGWVLTNNKKKNEAKTAIVAESNTTVAVKTAPVVQKPLSPDFTANGQFAPFRQLNFASETNGRVLQVLVDEGDQVSKGQTLAVIKTDGLSVDLQSAQENYQNALADKTRFENAYATGGVTRQQLDQAELALKNAAFRVEQAKIRLADANIRSSINGIINKRSVEPGAVVNPNTPLFEIVDVAKLKLKVLVNEEQVARLKTGDKVKVKVSVFPDKEFEGTIRFIAAKADGALNFPVDIEMNNTAGTPVKAGMYATAVFRFPEPAPSLVVPRTAFNGSVSSNQVFVMTADSTAIVKNVVSGKVAGEEVEILQGLQEGDRVIISGQVNLSEGSRVSMAR